MCDAPAPSPQPRKAHSPTAARPTRWPEHRSGLDASENEAAAPRPDALEGGTGEAPTARGLHLPGRAPLLGPLPSRGLPVFLSHEQALDHARRVTRDKRRSPPQHPRSPVSPCVLADPAVWPRTGPRRQNRPSAAWAHAAPPALASPPVPGVRAAPSEALSCGAERRLSRPRPVSLEAGARAAPCRGDGTPNLRDAAPDTCSWALRPGRGQRGRGGSSGKQPQLARHLAQTGGQCSL